MYVCIYIYVCVCVCTHTHSLSPLLYKHELNDSKVPNKMHRQLASFTHSNNAYVHAHTHTHIHTHTHKHTHIHTLLPLLYKHEPNDRKLPSKIHSQLASISHSNNTYLHAQTHTHIHTHKHTHIHTLAPLLYKHEPNNRKLPRKIHSQLKTILPPPHTQILNPGGPKDSLHPHSHVEILSQISYAQ
jgi:hypothetical protein